MRLRSLTDFSTQILLFRRKTSHNPDVIFPEGLKFSATFRRKILELRKTFNTNAEFR